MSNNNTTEIKLILLGECGVGKTCIINKYINDKFDSGELSTSNVKAIEKTLIINKKKIKLDIWDTVAQEKYRSISKIFYQNTQILILVYDVTNKKSFDELEYWRNSFYDNNGNDVIVGVAGNKEDLFLEKIVNEEEGKEYSTKINAIFAQLSAKTNRKGIDDFIMKLVLKYLNRNNEKPEVLEEKNIQREKGILLDKNKVQNKKTKKGGCCGGGKSKNENLSEEDKDNIIESIFLGAQQVGKTSLINRIVGKDFNIKEKHTTELEEYETDYINEEQKKILKIYDINNEKREDKKTQNIIRKCQIYFLVYDLNDVMSFKEIENWLKVINKYKEKDKVKTNYVFAIIGNKKDLLESNKSIKKPDIEGGKKLAILNNAAFCSTTAKEDKDIKNIIDIACRKFFNSN
jgi:small GTP-binding protein